jgi:hypothetical protein
MAEDNAIDNSPQNTPSYQVRVLGTEWSKELLRISRKTPVKSDKLRILFDRSPNIFLIPKLTSYRCRCLGLFKNDKLIGYALASYQKRYVNGNLKDVIYLGNMHVTEKGTGRLFLNKLSDRFSNKIPKHINVEYLYAYVIQQNRSAMKLVSLGHLYSRVAGKITMSNIFTIKPMRLSNSYRVRQARYDDIDDIVEMLKKEHSKRFLSPEMSHKIFYQNLAIRPNFGIDDYILAISGDEILGVCSAWDMTPIKKNRILSYGKSLGIIRLLYNVAALFLGSPRLPKAGESLKDVTIAEYAVKDRDPKIMEALLRFVYRHYRRKGYHSIIFGSSIDDPLLKANKSFISKDIPSNVILGSGQKEKIDNLESIPLIYADAIQI